MNRRSNILRMHTQQRQIGYSCVQTTSIIASASCSLYARVTILSPMRKGPKLFAYYNFLRTFLANLRDMIYA